MYNMHILLFTLYYKENIYMHSLSTDFIGWLFLSLPSYIVCAIVHWDAHSQGFLCNFVGHALHTRLRPITRDGNLWVEVIILASDWLLTLVHPIRSLISSLTRVLTLTTTHKFPPLSTLPFFTPQTATSLILKHQN